MAAFIVYFQCEFSDALPNNLNEHKYFSQLLHWWPFIDISLEVQFRIVFIYCRKMIIMTIKIIAGHIYKFTHSFCESLVTLAAWVWPPLVSVIKWVIRLLPFEKALPHWLHVYDFSPVWITIHMTIECLPKKTLSTIAALTSLPSVNPHMGFNIAVIWECLVTVAALL